MGCTTPSIARPATGNTTVEKRIPRGREFLDCSVGAGEDPALLIPEMFKIFNTFNIFNTFTIFNPP